MVQGLQADLRAAVLLLLVARCKGSPAALTAAGGVNTFLALLKDDDVRVCHIAAAFLQVMFVVMHVWYGKDQLQHGLAGPSTCLIYAVHVCDFVTNAMQEHLSSTHPHVYRQGLRHLATQAQQGSVDCLQSPYYQLTTMLDIRLLVPT